MTAAQQKAFKLLFPNGTGFAPSIKGQIKAEKTANLRIQSAIWKFLLFVFPQARTPTVLPQEWMAILERKREEYAELKAKYLIQPTGDENEDPLSKSGDSAWQQYFADKELREMISTDVIRFTEDEDIRKSAIDICFIHLRDNPHFKYYQELHHFCGTILKLFKAEMIATDSSDPCFASLFCPHHIDADAYWTYSELIKVLYPFIEYSEIPGEPSYSQIKCSEIQDVMLPRYSRDLKLKLVESQLDPRQYMNRWIHVLFLNIFDDDSIIPVWTRIFSYFPRVDFIYYICLALLLSVQSEILNAETENDVMMIVYRLRKDKSEPILRSATSRMEAAFKPSTHSEMCEAICKDIDTLRANLGVLSKDKIITELQRFRDALSSIASTEEKIQIDPTLDLITPPPVVMDEKPQKEEITIELPKASRKTKTVDLSILDEEEKTQKRVHNDLFQRHSTLNPFAEEALNS